MHTETTTPNPEYLRDLVQRIRDWQTARALSDSALCKQWAGLGSTKTYKRILDGDFDELNLERQLHNYQQAWNLMEIESSREHQAECDYDDLAHVEEARLAVTDALAERGNNRLVIIEGPSGAGKSTIARCLAQRWPNVAVLTEADETWKESPMVMFGQILMALGVRQRGEQREHEIAIPTSAEGRKQKTVELLSIRKRILIIDEAHHLGIRTLNLVKTLLNETPTVIVFLAIPTLLKRLETAAYEESRQLTRNRLCERVHVNGPPDSEVLAFLTRRQVTFIDPKAAKACAAELAKACLQYGHWNFINLVARKARRAKGDHDLKTFLEEIEAVRQTR